MRFYALLLNLYPAAFREEYGELLQLQFRDELEAIKKENKLFHLLGFWAFILIDLVKSLVSEYHEEIVNMSKKNLSTYSGFAAIFTAIAWCLIWVGGNVSIIGRNEIVSMSLFSVILMGGAVTLFGVIEAVLKVPVYRVLGTALLAFAGLLVLENIYIIAGWTWLQGNRGKVLFESVYWIAFFGYFMIAATIGIGLLIQRQWLPAACLFAIALPVLINPLVNLFNALWIITFSGILTSVAWLLIGRWVKKQAVAV